MWEYFRVVARNLATPPYATPPARTKCEDFEEFKKKNLLSER
jgi:hypothetical protein